MLAGWLVEWLVAANSACCLSVAREASCVEASHAVADSLLVHLASLPLPLLSLLLLPLPLQGGVPLPVYNTVHMMMPMQLQRIKMAAARLKPTEVAQIKQRQAALVAASKVVATQGLACACDHTRGCDDTRHTAAAVGQGLQGLSLGSSKAAAAGMQERQPHATTVQA